MSGLPILTFLTLLPLIGGLIVVGTSDKKLARNLALGLSFLSLALALGVWKSFDAANGALQFVEKHEWIPSLGVQYFVGVDGLGLLMVLLASIVVPMALLVSDRITDRVPLYHGLVLFLQAGLIGTFTALNFFHWFLFWELSLIPACFASSSSASRKVRRLRSIIQVKTSPLAPQDQQR